MMHVFLNQESQLGSELILGFTETHPELRRPPEPMFGASGPR